MQTLIKKLLDYKPTNPFEDAERLAFANFLQRNLDALDRTNSIAHVTASSWIVNEDMTKVLMCYHNIYKSWSWTGGHADGNIDLKQVAVKEAMEETGIKNFTVLTPDFYDVEVIPVPPHFKRGFAIGNHLHLNVTYLLMADENELLRVKEDENSKLAWLDVDKLDEFVSEKDMLPIYHRLQEKAIELRKEHRLQDNKILFILLTEFAVRPIQPQQPNPQQAAPQQK